MNHETIRDDYFELLKAYVTRPEEEGLVTLAALGRELAAADVPPEDVTELHEGALDRLAGETPHLTLPEAVRLTSAPLRELMVAYGLTCREQIEQLEHQVADYAEMEARHAHFQSLLEARSEVNQQIVREKDPQKVLAATCEVLERTRGYDGMWIGMLEQANTRVHAVARAGVAAGGKPAEVSLDDPGATLTCARSALRTGEPYLVRDVDESHPCASCTYRQIVPHVSSLAVPVLFQGERYGVIVVYSQRPWAFGDEETELLVELAGDLGLGLRTARANAALRASEEDFRGLFENAVVGIGISTSAGKVVALNRAMIEITGYSLEEFSKISLGDTYVNSGDRKRFLEIMKRDGMVAGFDVQLRNKEGEPYWASLSSRPIIYKGEDDLLTTALDITDRVRAEEALARQEAELRATLYGIGDAVIATDMQGRVARMNPVAERLTGWSEAEAADRPLDEVFHIINEETRRHVESPVARVLREGVVAGLANHTVLIAKDGKEIPIADSGAPITDAQGEITGVVLVFRDQTEERRSQQFQRLLSSLVESSFDTILGKTLDGTIVSWNAAAERMFGYTAQEMVGQSILKLVPPDRTGEALQWLEKVGQGEGLELLETVRQRKDGQLIQVTLTISPIKNDVGKVIGVSTISRDETERKRAEEALRQSEEKYRGLFNSIRDAILVADTNRNIIDCNAAFTSLFGYTLGDLQGKQTVYVYENEEEFNELGKALREHYGDSPFLKTVNYKKKTGEVFPGETSVYYLKDDRGEVTGFIGLIRDISARVEAEQALKEYSERLEEMVEERTQELRDAQEELVSKEKLAVLGQLAGGMAHELRNPLGAISNAAYLLHLFIEKPEPDVAEALQILDFEVRNSDRIINSLLDFARPSPSIAHRMDVNAAVEEALSRADLPANVEVVRELDESQPHAVADPEHLRQALGNIMRNAVQAMPEGGRLAVNSERCGGELPDTGQWVQVAVSDTGVGIPPENLDRLFEPLFTTKAKGIGLGLALCKMLVEASGGTIEAQSPSTFPKAGEAGKGSTFTVRLPVSREP